MMRFLPNSAGKHSPPQLWRRTAASGESSAALPLPGTLDAEEVTLFAKQLDDSLEFSVEEITKAMLAMDSDGDGAVTFEEFNEWFEARSRPGLIQLQCRLLSAE